MARTHNIQIRNAHAAHSDVPQIPCTNCDRSFKSKSGLTKHIRAYHSGPQNNPQDNESEVKSRHSSLSQPIMDSEPDAHGRFLYPQTPSVDGTFTIGSVSPIGRPDQSDIDLEDPEPLPHPWTPSVDGNSNHSVLPNTPRESLQGPYFDEPDLHCDDVDMDQRSNSQCPQPDAHAQRWGNVDDSKHTTKVYHPTINGSNILFLCCISLYNDL